MEDSEAALHAALDGMPEERLTWDRLRRLRIAATRPAPSLPCPRCRSTEFLSLGASLTLRCTRCWSEVSYQRLRADNPPLEEVRSRARSGFIRMAHRLAVLAGPGPRRDAYQRAGASCRG